MWNYRDLFFRLFSAILLIACLTFVTFASAAEDIELPSAGDIIAPLIEHTPINGQIAANTPTEVRATVTDNVGVREVTLFYRNVGASQFTRKQMQKVAGTDEYILSLGTIESPGIEYYLQATDLAGNTLLRGAEFQPMVISVAPALLDDTSQAIVTSEVTGDKSAIATPENQWKKYLYIGLGVAAVGLALNKGDSGDPPSSKTATVTVTAPAP